VQLKLDYPLNKASAGTQGEIIVKEESTAKKLVPGD